MGSHWKSTGKRDTTVYFSHGIIYFKVGYQFPMGLLMEHPTGLAMGPISDGLPRTRPLEIPGEVDDIEVHPMEYIINPWDPIP